VGRKASCGGKAIRKPPPRNRGRQSSTDEAYTTIGLTDKLVRAIAGPAIGQKLVLETSGKQYQSDDVWQFLLWA